MKTAEVELYDVTWLLAFKQVFMAQKLETRCEKKIKFILFKMFKIQLKKTLLYQN